MTILNDFQMTFARNYAETVSFHEISAPEN